MSTQRRQHIRAFRQLSGYLLWFSMPLLILSGLGGFIALLIFLFLPNGDLSFSAVALEIANNTDIVEWAFQAKLTLFTRLICFTLAGILFSMILHILLHFHKLIECFYDGEIFNLAALSNARKIFKMNLHVNYLILTLQAICIAIVWSNSSGENFRHIGHFIGNTFSFILGLAFLCLLLWALEIGTDINEEAELTI